jgi:hypothetical protein
MPPTTEVACAVPTCTRPVGTRAEGPKALKLCNQHFNAFEVEGALEDWVEAKHLLQPWVDAAKAIGHRELIIGMEESLERVEEEIAQHKAAVEEARAAL